MTNEEISKKAPATYLSLVPQDFWWLIELPVWLRREAELRRVDMAESSLQRGLSKDEQLSV
jgi:hypothetical protein